MNNFLFAGLVIFCYMVCFYLVSRIVKNNSIVDIGWGFGFIITAFSLLIHTGNLNLQSAIFVAMIVLWGMRLTIHIFLRNKGKGEDFRYAEWRKNWGKKEPWIAFYKIYLLQGFLMWIIAFPIILIFATDEQVIGLNGITGMSLFIAGFLFESISDYQLNSFKNKVNGKGKIFTGGLWKYTRHPNYFGEAVLWWGIGIYATSDGIYLLSLLSPIIITFLLRYVSGVPFLEKKYAAREDFMDYAGKTPVFVPFIGKKGLI